MPTQDLPCKPQPDNEDLMLCIEKFFERLANCSLVWVNHTDSLSKELQPCSSRKHWTLYTRLFIELNDHSAKDIYQMTGCFHTCTYYVKSLIFFVFPNQ
jgi:formate dehydrogenase assembly factor FdhD